MFILVVIVTSLLLGYRLKRMATVEDNVGPGEVLTNGAWAFNHVYEVALEQYGVPFMKRCICFLHEIYLKLTLVNMIIFIIKYVPTGIYMYKFIKGIYITSRERIKQKQIELEDIQLQIQIVNTKLCVRDSEMTERADELRRGVERLRQVRARVRGVISSDDSLRSTLYAAHSQAHAYADTTSEEEREFLMELLKDLKYDQVAIPEKPLENMECGEHALSETHTSENSIYTSASDADIKQDCHVKIVRVTNVYKVAYLKHYIKQKRLRRATKQVLLKKKMESIKKLMEYWQKMLNMVINTKLTVLNLESQVDVASQEAMGDYSKPNLRESSGSDSDLKNGTETYNDEYGLSWTQNPYRNYTYNYEDIPETVVSRDCYDTQEFATGSTNPLCDYPTSTKLCTLMEETTSQMAIDEIKSEVGEDGICQEFDI
ncbi:uncharacterized protein LOC131845830 [Achroia grisella]|uniref:uncharacterized protein LOC131845830 n=1 Tax=Achroia grisella TaxID=688607 RepID=UPI0027D324D3|nr:uncharacterized protein LOC131845830 [Achroia grisella]